MLSREDFQQLVTSDLKNEGTLEESEFLRKSENQTRWYLELITLKRDVESQFVARKVSFIRACRDGTADDLAYHEWRMAAVRFIQYIEERICELKLKKLESKDTQREFSSMFGLAEVSKSL